MLHVVVFSQNLSRIFLFLFFQYVWAHRCFTQHTQMTTNSIFLFFFYSNSTGQKNILWKYLFLIARLKTNKLASSMNVLFHSEWHFIFYLVVFVLLYTRLRSSICSYPSCNSTYIFAWLSFSVSFNRLIRFFSSGEKNRFRCYLSK